MVNHDEILRAFTTVNDDAPPFPVNWAKVMQDAQEATRDAYFNSSLPALSYGPTVPPDLPRQLTVRDDVTRENDIIWVKCYLLSVRAKKGCPRVYKLESIPSLDRIGVPDMVVTALFWSHLDALSTFLDMKLPLVYFLFHNWVGESGRWFKNSRFCIKRERIEVTVCGLLCVMTEINEVLQVGFLKENTVEEWGVGCVYTLRSGGKRAWERKGSVHSEVSMEQSITIVKQLLGVVPAYMCSISKP